MLFGENKVILKQRAKDAIWFYEEIHYTNRGIFALLDMTPKVISKAEAGLEKPNKNKIPDMKGVRIG